MPHFLLNATVVIAMLFALGVNIIHRAGAQEVITPSPGSFEQFVRKRLGGGDTSSLLLENVLDKYSFGAPPQSIRPPAYPYSLTLSILPTDDERSEQYVDDLKDFLRLRSTMDRLESEYHASVNLHNALPVVENADDQRNYTAFAQSILELNGAIFWAPASKASDIVNQMGDEIRAVFGPIPAFDTGMIGKTTREDGTTIETAQLKLEVDGNIVELKPNPTKPGSPLEYEHTNLAGQIVRWTNMIDKCDKPSLAGGVTPCGTSSRISRVTRRDNPVEWIALARKTKGVERLNADPYWMPGDSTFALVGYIGFNSVTGEVAFLDGSYVLPGANRRFSWTKPIVPPGGSGYKDTQGRRESSRMYDATFQIDCAKCHDNREPIIITPYIKHARVGYRNQKRREVGSVGDLFPEKLRNRTKPYRVVGTGYTAVHADTLDTVMSIGDPSPSKTCTGCHSITNNGTGRFASDAVGRLGELDPNDDDEGEENKFRTAWAKRSGAGQIHPWMVPEDGQDISRTPPREISDEEWKKLKAAINDPSSVSGSQKIYTATPAPESLRTRETLISDPSAPAFRDPTVMPGDDGQSVIISLSWDYYNSLGGVPERDDVRFHLAIRDVALPSDGVGTNENDYPSMAATTATQATRILDEIYRQDDIVIITNISFDGHRKWTEPAPTKTARLYKVRFPGVRGRRYLVRILAKRFGFDRGGEVFSDVDHVFAIDVPVGR